MAVQILMQMLSLSLSLCRCSASAVHVHTSSVHREYMYSQLAVDSVGKRKGSVQDAEQAVNVGVQILVIVDHTYA